MSNATSARKLQRRIYELAYYNAIVMVSFDTASFRGAIVTIDNYGYEVMVTDPMASEYKAGEAVRFSYKQAVTISSEYDMV